MELNRYEDVLKMAISLFFEDYEPKLGSLSLADSNGMPIKIACAEKWSLGSLTLGAHAQRGLW